MKVMGWWLEIGLRYQSCSCPFSYTLLGYVYYTYTIRILKCIVYSENRSIRIVANPNSRLRAIYLPYIHKVTEPYIPGILTATYNLALAEKWQHNPESSSIKQLRKHLILGSWVSKSLSKINLEPTNDAYCKLYTTQ